MPSLETIITVGGYAGITAIVFAESGLFFGFFLPGDSLLFTAGFLASQGVLDIVPLIVLIVIAAIAGDTVGYWTGRKVGPYIFTKPDSLLFSQRRVQEAKAFFDLRGPSSIILARFIPAVRTFTPIIAGVAGMNYRIFITYNIIGAFIWGAGLPLAGYYLGSTIPGIDKYIVPIVGVIIVVSVLPIVIPVAKQLLMNWNNKKNKQG